MKSTYAERRFFLQKHIRQDDKNRHTTNKRAYTREYFLPVGDNNIVKVCKPMFIHTLGKKTDGFISAYFKSIVDNNLVPVIHDGRGKKTKQLMAERAKQNKILIEKHVEKFLPTISHYARANCPNRRYLVPELSIKYMWKNFRETNNFIEYNLYRKVFSSMNIGFGSPSTDLCAKCEKQRLHKKHHPESEECEQCQSFENHKQAYTTIRADYERDKTTEIPDNTIIYTVDMQQVILLPKMELKQAFFTSRLVVFNETFAPLNNGEKNLILLWHEGISGRGASDVASTFYKVIKNAPDEIDKFVFWTDNCAAQNKNWLLFGVLSSVVNANWGPKTITMKYLESGHTFMKADSVHGNIGKKMKCNSNIYDYQELKKLITSATTKNIVVDMLINDFKHFETGVKNRKRSSSGSYVIPILRNIKVAEFRKGNKSLFFKDSLDGEFKEAPFLRSGFNLDYTPMEQPRGLNTKKKETIVKTLVPYMPPRKAIFWLEMPENDSSTDANTIS